MNRRKDLLIALAERQPPDGVELTEEEINAVMRKMLEYYDLFDIETAANHGRIFRALYLNGGFKSYDEVAAAFYISPYTLDRYRQRYNKLAERLLKERMTKQKNHV